MNNAQPDKEDQNLSKPLQAWQETAPLPPRFQEQVWQRIARAEARPPLWSQFLLWMKAALPRRAVAIGYVTILLLAGVTAGYWESRHKTTELHEALGRRYVQMVDPFQTREP